MAYGQEPNTATRPISPKEISARPLLGDIASRLEGINERLSLANGYLHGAEEPCNATSPPGGSIHHLIDHIDMIVNSIGNRLDILAARL